MNRDPHEPKLKIFPRCSEQNFEEPKWIQVMADCFLCFTRDVMFVIEWSRWFDIRGIFEESRRLQCTWTRGWLLPSNLFNRSIIFAVSSLMTHLFVIPNDLQSRESDVEDDYVIKKANAVIWYGIFEIFGYGQFRSEESRSMTIFDENCVETEWNFPDFSVIGHIPIQFLSSKG